MISEASIVQFSAPISFLANSAFFLVRADVDSEGRVVLPLAMADFMARIMAQTDGSAS